MYFGVLLLSVSTVQKMIFSIKGVFSKCDQMRSFLRIWSHLLKKSLTENFNFCAVEFLSLGAFFVFYFQKMCWWTLLKLCIKILLPKTKWTGFFAVSNYIIAIRRACCYWVTSDISSLVQVLGLNSCRGELSAVISQLYLSSIANVWEFSDNIA